MQQILHSIKEIKGKKIFLHTISMQGKECVMLLWQSSDERFGGCALDK